MRLNSRSALAVLLAAATAAAGGGMQAAHAQEAKAEAVETSIPFANMGGIRDWSAVDDTTLYVQDSRRNWYLAKLLAPCTDLTFVTAIGFETKGANRLDRFASVIVGGQRCQLTSFVASGPPPAKTKAAPAAQ